MVVLVRSWTYINPFEFIITRLRWDSFWLNERCFVALAYREQDVPPNQNGIPFCMAGKTATN
jgi:hypothetical protein